MKCVCMLVSPEIHYMVKGLTIWPLILDETVTPEVIFNIALLAYTALFVFAFVPGCHVCPIWWTKETEMSF